MIKEKLNPESEVILSISSHAADWKKFVEQIQLTPIAFAIDKYGKISPLDNLETWDYSNHVVYLISQESTINVTNIINKIKDAGKKVFVCVHYEFKQDVPIAKIPFSHDSSESFWTSILNPLLEASLQYNSKFAERLDVALKYFKKNLGEEHRLRYDLLSPLVAFDLLFAIGDTGDLINDIKNEILNMVESDINGCNMTTLNKLFQTIELDEQEYNTQKDAAITSLYKLIPIVMENQAIDYNQFHANLVEFASQLEEMIADFHQRV
jgi:hypothetical protein